MTHPAAAESGSARDLAEIDPMKFVTAYIKPHQLDDVREVLQEAGISGLSVAEIHDLDAPPPRIDGDTDYRPPFIASLKIEVAVNDDIADLVIDSVTKAARTGSGAESKVYVWELDRAVRIRTREKNTNAI